jgi:hypothetical protein
VSSSNGAIWVVGHRVSACGKRSTLTLGTPRVRAAFAGVPRSGGGANARDAECVAGRVRSGPCSARLPWSAGQVGRPPAAGQRRRVPIVVPRQHPQDLGQPPHASSRTASAVGLVQARVGAVPVTGLVEQVGAATTSRGLRASAPSADEVRDTPRGARSTPCAPPRHQPSSTSPHSGSSRTRNGRTTRAARRPCGAARPVAAHLTEHDGVASATARLYGWSSDGTARSPRGRSLGRRVVARSQCACRPRPAVHVGAGTDADQHAVRERRAAAR